MGKAPKTENHQCFVEADKYLAEYNTAIDYVYSITDSDVKVRIGTYKVNTGKRGKRKILLASHCPFCGSSLQRETNG